MDVLSVLTLSAYCMHVACAFNSFDKGGQNTRYPIPESELLEPRSEVSEPELPNHNFG
jgi:hypothetical protein